MYIPFNNQIIYHDKYRIAYLYTHVGKLDYLPLTQTTGGAATLYWLTDPAIFWKHILENHQFVCEKLR